MSRYIDAEKLKAEIKGFRNIARERVDDKDTYFLGMAQGYDNSISIIESIQQEQPEVDLEKEMEKYFGENWKDGTPIEVQDDMINFARHFYELDKGRKER